MRKTISRFTSSFAALLTDQTTVIDADGRTENIRSAMLQALSQLEDGQAADGAKTGSDVMRATDIQTLWYLRSDLLLRLSECHGEQVARQRLDAITEMFRGIVHKNQMPVRNRSGGKLHPARMAS